MNPPFTGLKVVTDIPIDDVYKLIDTHLLFTGHWHFRRTRDSEAAYQQILKNKAQPAFEEWKKKCKEEKIFEPKVVYGYFGPPVTEQISKNILKSKQLDLNKNRLNNNGFLPICSVTGGFIPLQLVTVGSRVAQKAQWLFAAHEYTDYLYLHGIAAATTEALAEYWHRHILKELNLTPPFSKGGITRLPAGSRISPGYPSWPNLADQKIICDLLDSKRIGVTLTESYQLVPEYSTSAMIVIGSNVIASKAKQSPANN